MTWRGLLRPAAVLVVGAALISCRQEPVTTSPSGSGAPTTPIASSRSAVPSPVVGEWTRINSCEAFVRAFERAHLHPLVTEWLVSAGYFVRADQVDPTEPCRGAIEDRNSYFFEASGRFGSLDQDVVVVDSGEYSAVGDGTIAIEGKTSGRRLRVWYRVEGRRISFHVPRPAGCAGACRDDLAWLLSMFYPGELTRAP